MISDIILPILEPYSNKYSILKFNHSHGRKQPVFLLFLPQPPSLNPSSPEKIDKWEKRKEKITKTLKTAELLASKAT